MTMSILIYLVFGLMLAIVAGQADDATPGPRLLTRCGEFTGVVAFGPALIALSVFLILVGLVALPFGALAHWLTTRKEEEQNVRRLH